MYTRYVLWILLGIPPSSDDDDIEIRRDPHSDGISVESARQPSHSLYDHNDNISYLGTIAEDDAEDIISVHLFDHDDERPRPFWKRYERPAWIIRIVILSALLVTLAVSLATKHNETGGSNLDVDVDVPFPSASPSKPSLSTSTSATFEGSSPSVEKSVLLINMQSPPRTPLVLVEEKNGVFVDFPLDICEGDCDHDSDCRVGGTLFIHFECTTMSVYQLLTLLSCNIYLHRSGISCVLSTLGIRARARLFRGGSRR